MRIDFLRIGKYKNITNIEIDFDESEPSTVLIGENGTGKSNVIEALVTIFRDLDLNETTHFSYLIRYNCNGNIVTIDNFLGGDRINIEVNNNQLSRAEFHKDREHFLPSNVFGYYSGSSRRLEQLFDRHQLRYYKKVISPSSKPKDIKDTALRRLFYCRPTYGQLALLSYFAFDSESAAGFLKKHMGIVGFDSALIILRRPRWAGSRKGGAESFWNASGLVRSLLERLKEHSLAPFSDHNREQDDYRAKAANEEQLYLFISSQDKLSSIASSFGDERTFFSLLETLDISDLVREVRIWVKKENGESEIPFHEISDGEKQLLSVLGLMRFTRKEESLFLLDEPDTHLNPSWKWSYLGLVSEIAAQSGSHIILTSHDPLTIGGLMASQVQVMSKQEDGSVAAKPPKTNPRGLGFTSILTQIFGLHTTLDPETDKLLKERNRLIRKGRTSKKDMIALAKANNELRNLGFVIEDREPEYEEFLRAYAGIRQRERTTLSPDKIAERQLVAEKMLREIIEKHRGSR
ncbi:AAA family ATPase [Stenotrophomonas sepilia]|uniref:AAA family ATPase n=1 Tax=Stenotrophomonas sepilia TaxID=2860290 RepID=UPI002E77661A|nr:AAA family ATPase [Stenotrophomonas sepilia]